MKFAFIILGFIFSSHSWSQKFELKGSLGPNPSTKKPIEFTLNWEEREGRLQGIYNDNFYGQKANLKGITSEAQGRIMIVTLPKENQGVRTIAFLGSDLKGDKGAALIPVSVVLRDEKGAPVRTTQVDANLKAVPVPAPMVAQKQEEPVGCEDGFGSLAGFCGAYKGMLTEEEDSDNKCNLLTFNTTHLVLEETGEVRLQLGDPSTIISSPTHRIGRIPANPENTDVDLMSRSCRPLDGITFKGDNCKRLTLIGSYGINGKTKHFSGTYTVIDENTNETCRYSLSMDQQQ